jgi:hypothetical protein
MKHYIATLAERNGEYLYNHVFKMRARNDSAARSRQMRIAGKWYEGEREKSDTGFYFHSSEVHVEPGSLQEISQAAYDEITLIEELHE